MTTPPASMCGAFPSKSELMTCGTRRGNGSYGPYRLNIRPQANDNPLPFAYFSHTKRVSFLAMPYGVAGVTGDTFSTSVSCGTVQSYSIQVPASTARVPPLSRNARTSARVASSHRLFSGEVL